MDIVQRKQTIVSYRGRRIFRGPEADVIAVEISAGRIRRRKRPELVVDLRWIAWVSCVVLRDGLHRPFHGVPGRVLHGGMKTNSRRIGVQANHALKLNPGPWIGGSGEFHLAMLTFRNLSKGKRSVVDEVGIPQPMLFVFAAL